MNTRASRCAIWRLHAPPSRYERIQPQAKERTAKLPPNRVTFLNGPNRDFPKWRRHHFARQKPPFLKSRPLRLSRSFCGSAVILLPFYHLTSENLEELQKLVALIDTNKIKLVLTERVKDRFKRNRAADAMQKLLESRFCDRRQLDYRSLTKSE